MAAQKPITPHILHKDCVDDVLLQSVRDVIPAQIDVGLWNSMAQDWTEQAQASFAAVYRRQADVFVLRTLPRAIYSAPTAGHSEFDVDFSAFYSAAEGRLRLSASHVPLSVESYLRQTFLPDEAPIGADEAAGIAELLAAAPQWKTARVNSYLVLNDTKNYFFYKKPHEHVPGLMLIEVARQAMYHYVYNMSGYDRGDVSISMSNLNVRFSSYTESTYPVEVLVTQTEGIARKEPKFVDKTATFYQNGRELTKIRLQGGAMKMKLFKRMRTLNFPETHWFVPSSRILPRALLTNGQGFSTQVEIVELSMTGLYVKPADKHGSSLQDPKSVSIHAKDLGFICLPVDSARVVETEGRILILFGDLERDQSYALKEAIKCHCFFSREEKKECALALEGLGKPPHDDHFEYAS